MGVYNPAGPPEGGKVVFEAIRVSEWFAANFEYLAGIAAQTFFEYADKTHLFKEESEKWLEHYRLMIRSAVFRNGMPGRAFMTWNEGNRKTLYLGLYNRLCILRMSEIWDRLTFEGRVEIAFRILWATFLRCAIIRAAAYYGEPIPPERPFLCLDPATKPHLLNIDRIRVTSFGTKEY